MTKIFVEFFSPGSFVAEKDSMPIDSYNIEKACEMSKTITQRYDAKPYGFRFVTRSRGDNDLDSHISDTSAMYYIDGTVLSLEELETRGDPRDRILISNMKSNKWSHVVRTFSPYLWTQPLERGDKIVDSSTGEVIFTANV